jgi:serine/threonine protein phosphatase 1
MAVYILADIHGMYDKFMRMLDKINMTDEDILYVLGDMVDRGPHSIKVVQKIMNMKNVRTLIGNHDSGVIGTLKFFVMNDSYRGDTSTEREFQTLDQQEKMNVIEFLSELPYYYDISVNDQQYILVHGGLGNFSPGKSLDEYSIDEIVWTRPDFSVPYYTDRIVVCGHTPTQLIEENDRPGYIMKKNNYIAIDCGACFRGGRLAAICLDTGEEFYV